MKNYGAERLGRILAEETYKDEVDTVVAIMVGRFQPFHAGHYSVYELLAKKFGKNNTYICTSNKTEPGRSPFNFREKQTIISTMFGVPKNKIVQAKNPYVPKEILSKYSKTSTAYVTAFSTKDAGRLGGKYFKPFPKDKDELLPYTERGYFIVAPEIDLGGKSLSGTAIRNFFTDVTNSEDDKKKEFKRLYRKFNPKIYDLIMSKLNVGQMAVTEEEILEFLSTGNLQTILSEISYVNGTNAHVDDGPGAFFPTDGVFQRVSQERAAQIGYTVMDYISNGGMTVRDHPLYPKGPIDAVSYFPAGDYGKLTAMNQEDDYGPEAYDKWFKHVTRAASLVGYEVIYSRAEKQRRRFEKKQSGNQAKSSKKMINRDKLHEDVLVEDFGITTLVAALSIGALAPTVVKIGNKAIRALRSHTQAKQKSLPSVAKVDVDLASPSLLGKTDPEIIRAVAKTMRSMGVKIALGNYMIDPTEENYDKYILAIMDVVKNAEIVDTIDDMLLGADSSSDSLDTLSTAKEKKSYLARVLTKMRKINSYGWKSTTGWTQKSSEFVLPLVNLRREWVYITMPLDRSVKPYGMPTHLKVKLPRDAILNAKLPISWTGNLQEDQKNLRYAIMSLLKLLDRKKLQTFSSVGEGIREGLLQEGGAFGHLAHPFDDMNLTFGDMKDMIVMGLSGGYDVVQEKLDGMNLMVTYHDGHVKAARSKTQLRDFGANALDVDAISAKFAGRGDVHDAFTYAMEDLEAAISNLSKSQKEEIFGNGRRYMNLEILYPQTPGTVPYGLNMIVFHGLNEYDQAGNQIGFDKSGAKALSDMIKKINQSVQKTFTLSDNPNINLPKAANFEKDKSRLLGKLKKLQSEFRLRDSDPVLEYHVRKWEQLIQKEAKKRRYNIPAVLLERLVDRWARQNKSAFSVNQMKKEIDNESFLEWVLKFDKESHADTLKDNLMPFELIFLDLAQVVLSGILEVLLVQDGDKVANNLRKEVEATIKRLKSSKDFSTMRDAQRQIEKIESMGGVESILPTEGIVFIYKDKLYKLTGSFAPSHQLLRM